MVYLPSLYKKIKNIVFIKKILNFYKTNNSRPIRILKMFFTARVIIYIDIIIILILGGALLFNNPTVRQTWVLATTIQPERFTELYFENHTELPKFATKDESYEFKFTIHNLEHQTKQYKYEISITDDKEDKQILKVKTLTLKHDEFATIPIYFKLLKQVDKARVVVKLVNKDQEIAFWIRKPGIE